jgi:hypothetical protein
MTRLNRCLKNKRGGEAAGGAVLALIGAQPEAVALVLFRRRPDWKGLDEHQVTAVKVTI